MTRIFCYALQIFILAHATFVSNPNIKELPPDEFKILLKSTDYTYVSIKTST